MSRQVSSAKRKQVTWLSSSTMISIDSDNDHYYCDHCCFHQIVPKVFQTGLLFEVEGYTVFDVMFCCCFLCYFCCAYFILSHLYFSSQPIWRFIHPSHVAGRGYARSGQPLWSILPACGFRHPIHRQRRLRPGASLQRCGLRLPTIPCSKWRLWHGNHHGRVRPLWRSTS